MVGRAGRALPLSFALSSLSLFRDGNVMAKAGFNPCVPAAPRPAGSPVVVAVNDAVTPGGRLAVSPHGPMGRGQILPSSCSCRAGSARTSTVAPAGPAALLLPGGRVASAQPLPQSCRVPAAPAACRRVALWVGMGMHTDVDPAHLPAAAVRVQ